MVAESRCKMLGTNTTRHPDGCVLRVMATHRPVSACIAINAIQSCQHCGPVTSPKFRMIGGWYSFCLFLRAQPAGFKFHWQVTAWNLKSKKLEEMVRIELKIPTISTLFQRCSGGVGFRVLSGCGKKLMAP